jgi:hypothetical protein
MRLVMAITKIVEATLSKGATKVGIKTVPKVGEATAIALSKGATKVGIKTVPKAGVATAIALSKAGTKVKVGIKTVPKAGVATAIALSKAGMVNVHKEAVMVVRQGVGALIEEGVVLPHVVCL